MGAQRARLPAADLVLPWLRAQHKEVAYTTPLLRELGYRSGLQPSCAGVEDPLSHERGEAPGRGWPGLRGGVIGGGWQRSRVHRDAQLGWFQTTSH